MTSKQHRSLFNQENFRTASKGKIKAMLQNTEICYCQLCSTYFEEKKNYEAGQKKAQLNPKKVRLCICHEAQWVSSKARCSALAFSGGYRGKGRVGRGEQRETTN